MCVIVVDRSVTKMVMLLLTHVNASGRGLGANVVVIGDFLLFLLLVQLLPHCECFLISGSQGLSAKRVTALARASAKESSHISNMTK